MSGAAYRARGRISGTSPVISALGGGQKVVKQEEVGTLPCGDEYDLSRNEPSRSLAAPTHSQAWSSPEAGNSARLRHVGKHVCGHGASASGWGGGARLVPRLGWWERGIERRSRMGTIR